MKIKVVKIIDKLFDFIASSAYNVACLCNIVLSKVKKMLQDDKMDNWILLRQAIEYLVDGREPTFDREQLKNRFLQENNPYDPALNPYKGYNLYPEEYRNAMQKIISWLRVKRLSIRCIEGELLLYTKYYNGYSDCLRAIIDIPRELQEKYHIKNSNMSKEGWGERTIISDFYEESYSYGNSDMADLLTFIAPPVNYIDFKSVYILWRSNIILDATNCIVDNEEYLTRNKRFERYMGYMIVRVNWKELQKLKFEDETNIKRKIDKKSFFYQLKDEMLKDNLNTCYYPDAMRAFYEKYGVDRTTKGCSESSLRDVMKLVGRDFYCEVPDKERSTRSPQNLSKYTDNIKIKYI